MVMSSNAIVPTSSGANFAQQGAVDWVALSKTTVGFSLEVLSRLSKAGVEPLTVASKKIFPLLPFSRWKDCRESPSPYAEQRGFSQSFRVKNALNVGFLVGQAIFSRFDVPPEGQKRLLDAVARLKAFASYGEVLWFGFGVKHITRTLCETEQGATCVAICACLSVSYDQGFVSQVLKACADLTKAPNSLTPSLSQWGALIAVCAGAVTNSLFSALVEAFSRLMGESPEDGEKDPLREATSPEALAAALQELCKVSNGSLRSVTFRGGRDCGWLAAVAQWLLCLRIEILDAKGNHLYSSLSHNGDFAQVLFLQSHSEVKDPESIALLGRSHFVPPGKLCFGIHNPRSFSNVSENINLYSSGRVEWDNLIRKAFGAAANELLHPNNVSYLAAYLCLGFDQNPIDLEFEVPNPWGGSSLHDCYQRRRAFMQFASVQLPELNATFTFAEEHGYEFKRTTLKDSLRSICACTECIPCGSVWNNSFCLHRIGAVIFKTLWILSWLDVEDSVKPSSSGLLIMYYDLNFGNYDPASTKLLFWQNGLSRSLFPLFTGTVAIEQNTNQKVSAISCNGVCIYYASLQDPDVSPYLILRLRVVLGQIERDGALYRRIQDTKFGRNHGENHIRLLSAMSRIDPNSPIRLVVEETLDSRTIEANYYINFKTSTAKVEQRTYSHSHHLLHNIGGVAGQFAVGICKMRSQIKKRLVVRYCQKRRVQVTSVTAEAPTTTIWRGECSDANVKLRNELEKDLLAFLPVEGEWVLVGRGLEDENRDACSISLGRGTYTFLYSALCNLELDSLNCSLLKMTSCIPCSILAGDGEPHKAERFGSVCICSMRGSRTCIFELPGRIHPIPDTNTTPIDEAMTISPSVVPSQTPPPPPPPSSSFSPYHNSTKKKLELFLAGRRIDSRRNARK